MPDIRQIALDRIRPNLRLVYSEDSVQAMVCDIQVNGLREPIELELVCYWFAIIDGEKRWRALKKLGKAAVPAILREE